MSKPVAQPGVGHGGRGPHKKNIYVIKGPYR